MTSVDMADDLEDLRVHLGLSDIYLLGQSGGGTIALAYAERYPQRVTKLVLIDSAVLGLTADSEIDRILASRSADPRFAPAVKAVSAYFAGEVNPAASDEGLQAFIAEVTSLYLHSPEKTLPLAREQLAGPISSYAFSSHFAANAASGTNQDALLGTITAKTLIIVGREDYICPVALSERLHEGIADSRLVIFEQSGHLPWIEEPDAFFPELEGFLTAEPA
jgi:pimeloyl-ACP methyl ester carboxylesterase